jgi:hypothetical protein
MTSGLPDRLKDYAIHYIYIAGGLIAVVGATLRPIVETIGRLI